MLKFAWTQNSDYSWNQHGQQGSAQQGLAAWEWARQDTDWDRTQIRRLTDASLKRGSVRRCYSSSNQHYDTGGAETQVGRGEREEERERERERESGMGSCLKQCVQLEFFFFFSHSLLCELRIYFIKDKPRLSWRVLFNVCWVWILSFYDELTRLLTLL